MGVQQYARLESIITHDLPVPSLFLPAGRGSWLILARGAIGADTRLEPARKEGFRGAPDSREPESARFFLVHFLHNLARWAMLSIAAATFRLAGCSAPVILRRLVADGKHFDP